ncbi:hypothetical protein BMS3Abin06_01186 [bacterium BMS3Abin06]|nr:hypothetical protein BMS3Abin06_01186 [bacterium BMS3Abin06]
MLLCLIVFIFSGKVQAAVSGVCSDCHTMHNSQGGQPMAYKLNASFTGFDPNSTPGKFLLVSDCVGCHTSAGNASIVNNVPVVFNTGGYPAQPLAAGNFYWVAQGAQYDSYGHNVYGMRLSAQDGTLTTAPGKTPGACGNSCHTSLAQAPGANNSNRGGCRGCHVFTAHHDDSRPWYRFLKGHDATNAQLPIPSSAADTADYVVGVEDNDWEQETAVDHNWYKGTDVSYIWGAGLRDHQTVTAFCSGCHGIFHGNPGSGDGMGGSSPWIRHPTDIILPQTGEYAGYNPPAEYSNTAPVAYTTPSSPSRATAVVMCLSCHRAHASPYYKMLRWDYKSLTLSAAISGCNVCHTSKN